MRILVTTFMCLAFFVSSHLTAAEKPESPLTISGAITLDAAQAKKLFDEELVFIDVRKTL